MTTVSIVVNNHDYARYLPFAIDSCLAQTWPAVQTVVVDDGSTDGSPSVIRGYGSRIVPVLKTNGGQASAFNAGLSVATGDVVVFLDADDTLLPDAAREAARVLASDHDIAKLTWPLWEIDATGRRTGGRHPRGELPTGDLREVVLAQGADCYLSSPTSGNAWSRTFLDAVRPLPEEHFRRGADGFLITVAPLFGTVERLLEPQGCYRLHDRNGFWQRAFEDRVRGALQRHHVRSAALADVVCRLGLPVRPDSWGNDYIHWLRRLDRTIETVRSALPDGAAYLLLDAGEWGPHFLAGHTAVSFLEADGAFCGPPADDRQAKAALDALPTTVGHVVVGWPAFWYLEHYAALTRFLDSCCERVVADDDVMVFRRRLAPGGGAW